LNSPSGRSRARTPASRHSDSDHTLPTPLLIPQPVRAELIARTARRNIRSKIELLTRITWEATKCRNYPASESCKRMEVIALFDVLRRHVYLIAVLCIVTTLAGYGISFISSLIPQKYDAAATVLVRPHNPIK